MTVLEPNEKEAKVDLTRVKTMLAPVIFFMRTSNVGTSTHLVSRS